MFKEKLKLFWNSNSGRLMIVFVLISLMFFGLVVKLFNMQIVQKETLEEEVLESAEEKEAGYKYYTSYTVGPRGNIYSKDGSLLAYNTIQYNVDFYNSAALTNNEDRNAAIYELIKLLKKYDLEKEFTFPLILDGGKLKFTLEGNSLNRFLKNCYGLISVNDLTEKQKNTTPEELYAYLKKGNAITSMFGISDKYSMVDTLEIMAYRYQLYINNPSYQSIRLCTDVSEEVKTIIMENKSLIPCIEISNSYKRHYNDSIFFSHIVGYVGAINETELAEFEAAGKTCYTNNSVVGKLGVEKSYDEFLQASLGEISIKVNSAGQVVTKTVEKNAKDGNDLYLTIDHDSQVAGYYLVEKNVAAIILSALNIEYDYGSKGESADDIKIPIHDVYASFITNNVIDINFEKRNDLSEAERTIYYEYTSSYDLILNRLHELMQMDNRTKYNDLGESEQRYLDYIYSSLRASNSLLTLNIDTNQKYFSEYINGNSSFAEFLYKAIEHGNIDTKLLGLDEGYYSVDVIYSTIIDYIFEKITSNDEFTKLIYRSLIINEYIKGRDLCLALFDQGVLKQDSDSYNGLLNYTLSSFDFVKRKINNLEITPAMLALSPCSGSIVVTDPNTGNVVAMVSYPSYDNNMLTNTIDYDYYSKVVADKSFPMLCRATQSRTTTGSTFKPLTAIAALTEGTITTNTIIHDDVKFTDVTPPPACWNPYSHGDLNVSEAIRDSCNYFFFRTAYTFSTNARGNYSDNQGLAVIHKYANMFGFDSYSGVEISESKPEISNTDAVRTSIGYYHNFAPIQISRYLTTIANSGTCYNLTLIDNVKNKDGEIVVDNFASVHNELNEVSQTSWDAVHYGMYLVVNSPKNELSKIFGNLGVTVAGKTGTAQVSLNFPNNALFVSYAPYDNPKICVTVVLPNGYKSANAATVAKEYYDFYFNGTNKNELLSGNVFAGVVTNTQIGD